MAKPMQDSDSSKPPINAGYLAELIETGSSREEIEACLEALPQDESSRLLSRLRKNDKIELVQRFENGRSGGRSVSACRGLASVPFPFMRACDLTGYERS